MIAEISVDNINRIVQRTLTGEIDTPQALSLVREISFAINGCEGYCILVDMRHTTYHPDMMDLLEIAEACNRQLASFCHKIAFVIPDTEQRQQVAKLFRACMEAQGFKFKQFFECDAALEWFRAEELTSQRFTV